MDEQKSKLAPLKQWIFVHRYARKTKQNFNYRLLMEKMSGMAVTRVRNNKVYNLLICSCNRVVSHDCVEASEIFYALAQLLQHCPSEASLRKQL